MTPYRPTGVLVIAILHLVFGGIGLFLDSCGLAMQLGGQRALMQMLAGPQAAQQTQMQDRMEKFMEERLPGYKVINLGEMGVQIAFDVMLLTAGVGLLRMRPWARGLSVTYAIASIGNRILIAVYQLLFVGPVTRELFERELQGSPMPPFVSSMMGAAGVLGAVTQLFYLVYPVVVLVIMFHPVTRAAFRGEYPEPDYLDARRRVLPDDYDEPFGRGDADERYRRDER